MDEGRNISMYGCFWRCPGVPTGLDPLGNGASFTAQGLRFEGTVETGESRCNGNQATPHVKMDCVHALFSRSSEDVGGANMSQMAWLPSTIREQFRNDQSRYRLIHRGRAHVVPALRTCLQRPSVDECAGHTT